MAFWLVLTFVADWLNEVIGVDSGTRAERDAIEACTLPLFGVARAMTADAAPGSQRDFCA